MSKKASLVTPRRRFLAGMLAVGGALGLGRAARAEAADDMLGPAKYKVVYQLNKADPGYMQEILHSAAVVLQQYNNEVAIAITCFGPGIWLLVKDAKNKHRISKFLREQVDSLDQYGVEFHACNQTMQTQHLAKQDLISLAKVVPSGAVDLIDLQKKGYAYIAW